MVVNPFFGPKYFRQGKDRAGLGFLFDGACFFGVEQSMLVCTWDGREIHVNAWSQQPPPTRKSRFRRETPDIFYLSRAAGNQRLQNTVDLNVPGSQGPKPLNSISASSYAHSL